MQHRVHLDQLLSVTFMLPMLRIEVLFSRPQRNLGQHALLGNVVSTDEITSDCCAHLSVTWHVWLKLQG